MSNSSESIYHQFLQSGDVVVGKYSKDGRRLKESVIAGDEETLQNQVDAMARSQANFKGAVPVKPPEKVAKPKGRPKKNVKRAEILNKLNKIVPKEEVVSADEPPTETQKVTKETIYLHNKLGKIKMFVEAVLENETAYCLVFSNEDEVIFQPNPGETLNFTDNSGQTKSVYFANSLFTWTDNRKQIMILFKTDE